MLADITIDGMVENEFRQAIETLLREGNADHAAKWLKSRLEALCGDGLPLPARFLAVTAADLTVTGWENIGNRLMRLDAAGSPITAIGINLRGPGHIGFAPDASGLTGPHLETNFYTDEAWPFSHCDRAGLLVGYERGTARWTDHFVEIDNSIGIGGIDDLHGAVLLMEQRCRPGGNATNTEHRAYMLGASYLAVLLHLAVRDTALQRGLPRALAVLVGSNESYPFFDAPALAAPEAAVVDPLPVPRPAPAPIQSGWDEPAHDYTGLQDLQDLAEPDADPGQEPEAWNPPEPAAHITGTQLRKRIVTPESIAELEAAHKPSLLQRIFRRA